MDATTPAAAPESLRRAQEELDRKFDQIAKEYAGHPRQEVLDVLERQAGAAGVTPARLDLSSLARQISAADAG